MQSYNRTNRTNRTNLAGPEAGLRILFHFCAELDLGYGRGGRQNRESPQGLQLLPEATRQLRASDLGLLVIV